MKPKIHVNDTVIVNTTIHRLEEQYELDARNKGVKPPECTTIEEYQAVDWSKWCRKGKIYAEEGERGTVVEIFHDFKGNRRKRVRVFAKVKIGDKIKTFRVTSLNKETK